jgi:hypothetical protein
MKHFELMVVAGLVLLNVPLWSQTDNTSASPAQTAAENTEAVAESDTRMVTPPPVSGQAYPIVLTSQERSNYLRGGLSFTAAYTDNALGSFEGTALSDKSYSVAPFIALDETTTREHVRLSYAPGYTFYQRFSGLDAADQNATIAYQYRLSPHVTFSASDTFQKTSNVFNQPDLTSTGTVGGGTQGANFSIIAPIANMLTNTGSVGLAYQFALNEMVGASGTFSTLHYPNPTQVPGLYDSSSQAGLAFYAVRASKSNYLGVMYGYQRLVAYPTGGETETQTHAPMLFYSVFPAKGLSLSFFGGPQYSDTTQLSPLPELKQWSPAGGGSISWQGAWESVALNYIHIISSASGLIEAVKLDSANASLRQRITKSLSASVSGGYTQNDVVGQLSNGLTNGHTIMGTASLAQQIGQHLNVLLGYTRMRQDYSGVAVLATAPNTNREFITVSYQFAKALGR